VLSSRTSLIVVRYISRKMLKRESEQERERREEERITQSESESTRSATTM
jgi:hypothetical protein